MANHRTNDTGSKEIDQTVSLPVLDSKQSGTRCGSKGGAPTMGRTKIARWRAGVLITVNVLMIAHLIQWLIMGMTISPIEPSEAMETLEVGVINAGAVLFLLTFLSTLILGRFFCGWLCHVVALQDLCAYIMNSVGIRPKPFRSRLLIYFPFFLGMYMFVWPTFKRMALAPLLKSNGIHWPAWLRPVEPIHEWSNGLVVDDFWATMPPWFIAVPFLFICGFAAVYFLGAKGFCTYGCPYAAFFKPMDKVAPVRIHVNDDCKQCGYCTSVCTSNVRVSDEVRDFGMVVDAGCMKTLDCISACPNDALSLGFGKPALGAKPISPETYKESKEKRSRRFDMTLGEELFASVLFLWFFFATRGLLDAVPMLMAGGLAAIGVMIVMTSVKLIRKPNARMYSYSLKLQGKIKPAGFLIILMALGFLVGSAWSGNARLMRWKGDIAFAKSKVPTSTLVRAEFQPSETMRKRAQAAVRAYQRADSLENGGLGWSLNAEHRLRLSYFLGVLGQYDQSLDELMTVLIEGNPTDELVLQAGQLSTMAIHQNPPEGLDSRELSAHQRQALLDIYQQALDAHPNLHAIRTELSRAALSEGDVEKGQAYWAIDSYDNDPRFFIAKARYAGFGGNMVDAKAELERAYALVHTLDRPAGMQIDIARSALQYQMNDYALELAQIAIDGESATALTWLAAGEIANASGFADLGKQRAQQALTMSGVDRPMVQARAAGVLMQPGETDRARELLTDAATRSIDPFEIMFIAQGMCRAGLGLGDEEMLDLGLGFWSQVVEDYPGIYVIRHDYSSMLYQAGRSDEALAQMTRVAELDSTNPVYPKLVAQLHLILGNTDEQQRWLEIASQRESALKDD